MSPDEVVGTALYARCLTCDLELATPKRAQKHRSETFRESEKTSSFARGGAGAIGHRTTTVNATAEEKRAWKIHRIVEDALEEAYMALDRAIDRDRITLAEVYHELALVFLEGGYANWRQDDEDEAEEEDGAPAVHPNQEQLL